MKSILKKLFSTTLLLILIVVSVSGQKKENKKEEQLKELQKAAELVKSGEFRFEAQRAYSQGGASISLTSNSGYLEVDKNIGKADLPFFGRAYRLDYGDDGGINFEGDISNESFKLNNKKVKATYSFDVRSKETFTVFISFFSLESVSVSIQCNTKSHISYTGFITKLEDKTLKEQ